MNLLIDLLDKAQKMQWCTKPNCTTCGANEYRSELHSLFGGNKTELANCLAILDLYELEGISEWSDPLRIAFDELNSAILIDQVLKSWLPELDNHIRLADFVLFYIVRRGAVFVPMSIDISKKWITKCVNIAVNTQDESLTESLIYTLGIDYHKYTAFESLAQNLSSKSRHVALAIQHQLGQYSTTNLKDP